MRHSAPVLTDDTFLTADPPLPAVSEPKPDVEYASQVQSVNVGAANIPAPAQAAQEAAVQAGQEETAQEVVVGAPEGAAF